MVVHPKSSILIGFSIINHPFWGTLIFGNTHMGLLDIKIYTPWNKQQVCPCKKAGTQKEYLSSNHPFCRCQLLVSGRVFDTFYFLWLKYGWWFRISRSPVEVGKYLPKFTSFCTTIPGGCLGFLNHQQYWNEIIFLLVVLKDPWNTTMKSVVNDMPPPQTCRRWRSSSITVIGYTGPRNRRNQGIYRGHPPNWQVTMEI